MYDGYWMGVEGIRIATFGGKESIESGFPGVGIMGSYQQIAVTTSKDLFNTWLSGRDGSLISMPDICPQKSH